MSAPQSSSLALAAGPGTRLFSLASRPLAVLTPGPPLGSFLGPGSRLCPSRGMSLAVRSEMVLSGLLHCSDFSPYYLGK